MDILQKTKELCRIYEIKPARNKGQNFLIKEETYDHIIEAADLNAEDVVLEVGPGLGFLTSKLASNAKKIIAVELDEKLAKVLKTGLMAGGVKNVEVINENILDYNLKTSDVFKDVGRLSYIKGAYKVVANLPYNITSIFLRKFLSQSELRPSMMVLMLQKEVAERITAKPGEMSLLAVSVQFYAEAQIVEMVPARDFWPKPEVDSAIVKLKIKKTSDVFKDVGRLNGEKEFFRLVKIGFSSKRKMLKNNLAAGYHIGQDRAEDWINNSRLNAKIRAQELSLAEWKNLLEAIQKDDDLKDA